MSESNTSTGSAVAATASRLRLVQIDFADQDEVTRREFLGEEIKRALGAVVPAERDQFLEQLQAQFPTWDGEIREPVSTSAQPAFDDRELRDPSFLTRRLIEVCENLPQSQRDAVTARLQEAGLVATGQMDWGPDAANAVRTKLGMASKDPIDSTRALDLISMLSDFTCSLDQVVWSAWRQIAPQTNVRRPAAVQKSMGRFATGDPNTPRGQVAQDINKLRTLVAGLIAALSQAGRFAVQYYKNFSPEEIKTLVGSSMLGSETRYWRKYVELANAQDAVVVESEIRKAIAQYAEDVMG